MYRQVPFFRMLLPFVVGIIISISIDMSFSALYLSLALLLLFALAIIAHVVKSQWAFRWIFGSIVFIFLIVAGFAITQSSHSNKSALTENEQNLILRVVESPEIRNSSIRVSAQISVHKTGEGWSSISERTLLYFSVEDSMAHKLKYGDILALKASFAAPPNALNPYQFDYANYLVKKGIYRVAYVKSTNWVKVDHKSHWLYSAAHNLRSSLLSLFKRVGIDDENLAVLSALTMGYKSLLDQETKRVFSASGAMHILAVSGLHVGILFTTLSAFLFFLNRVKRGKLIKASILIAFLWFFAVFTGLSPSVIRASLMFSLVILGTAFSHKISIYNTLSASAFVILAVNPMLITEVGFQLSYCAVVSIVFFYPHIYGLLYVKNKWLDKVWTLIAVSFAAQLGTFVLGIFYFNQFPNYFLLTNLYAIPLAFLILYLAIALICFAPIPFIANAVGWVLENTLSLLNYLVRFTDALPYSITSGISITISQVVTLSLAVMLFALLLEYRKLVYAQVLFALLLVFFTDRAYQFTQQSLQSEMVVFAQNKSSLIGFRQGHKMILFTSDTLDASTVRGRINFTINGYVNHVGVGENIEFLNFKQIKEDLLPNALSSKANDIGYWFSFNGQTVLVATGKNLENHITEIPLEIGILIICDRTTSNISHLLSLLNPRVIVVDQTIPWWQLPRIQESVAKTQSEVYIVNHLGAYIKRFPANEQSMIAGIFNK